jgi:cytochrome P450
MAIAVRTGHDVYYIDGDIEPAFDLDPASHLASLAHKHHVVRGEGVTFDGLSVPNHFLLPTDKPLFLALSFSAVKQVLSDDVNFSAAGGYSHTMGKTQGEVLFALDEPDHGRYRNLVAKAFRHRNVTEEWLDAHIAPVIAECLAKFERSGCGDLIQDFTLHYPYRVIAKVTGVPQKYDAELSQYTQDSLTLGLNPEAAMLAAAGQDRLFRKVVEDHRAEPKDDMTDALINAEIDGDRLTDDEICNFLRLLISAGLDTTYRANSSLLFQLFSEPEQFAAVRAEPDLLEGAISESLRMIPAGSVVPREAKRDVVIEGVKIPAGSNVMACLLTANYDHRIWDDPFRFDIRRPRKSTMTFGAGIHTCLGISLARAEIRLAMEALLQRLGNLRPDPAHWEAARVRGFGLRSPTSVPALWDPPS